jgi:hypothetical protein
MEETMCCGLITILALSAIAPIDRGLPDTLHRERPILGHAQVVRPRGQLDGRDGSFAEIRPVDPEYQSVPEEQPMFATAPNRPGAPPYSALYLGLRIR